MTPEELFEKFKEVNRDFISELPLKYMGVKVRPDDPHLYLFIALDKKELTGLCEKVR